MSIAAVDMFIHCLYTGQLPDLLEKSSTTPSAELADDILGFFRLSAKWSFNHLRQTLLSELERPLVGPVSPVVLHLTSGEHIKHACADLVFYGDEWVDAIVSFYSRAAVADVPAVLASLASDDYPKKLLLSVIKRMKAE
jgi:hypothetical protein